MTDLRDIAVAFLFGFSLFSGAASSAFVLAHYFGYDISDGFVRIDAPRYEAGSMAIVGNTLSTGGSGPALSIHASNPVAEEKTP